MLQKKKGTTDVVVPIDLDRFKGFIVSATRPNAPRVPIWSKNTQCIQIRQRVHLNRCQMASAGAEAGGTP